MMQAHMEKLHFVEGKMKCNLGTHFTCFTSTKEQMLTQLASF